MSGDDPFDEFFERKIELYELVDQRVLDRSDLNKDMSTAELKNKSVDILTEGPPQSKEEQIGFVLSSLRKQAKEDPVGFVKEMYDSKKRDIAKRLGPYESHEIDPFKPIFREIREFSDSELEIAGEWLNDFHNSGKGEAYSQQYHQLIENKLKNDRKISINDISSVGEGVDIYSETMNIADAGYPVPVALYWITRGEDPRQKDASSMGFKRGLQELEDSNFEAIYNHIDVDLRNGIKHGDMVIEPKEERLYIENKEKVYEPTELESVVNESLLAVDVMEAMDTYVSLVDYRMNIEFIE